MIRTIKQPEQQCVLSEKCVSRIEREGLAQKVSCVCLHVCALGVSLSLTLAGEVWLHAVQKS